jgi:hypothetical protein
MLSRTRDEATVAKPRKISMIRSADEVSMRVHFLLGVVAIAWGAGMACGGATDTGLFGGGGNGASGVDSGGITGSDGGIVPENDASSIENDASTTQHDSGGPPDKDSGNPPPKDSGPPPPNDPGVQCSDNGQVFCSVPTQSCCRIGQSNYTYQCMTTGQCQTLNQITLEIPCDDATDCATAGHAGQVCCAVYNGSSTATQVVCRDASQCSQAQSAVIVCDRNDPTSCPVAGTSCQKSTGTLPAYYICK